MSLGRNGKDLSVRWRLHQDTLQAQAVVSVRGNLRLHVTRLFGRTRETELA